MLHAPPYSDSLDGDALSGAGSAQQKTALRRFMRAVGSALIMTLSEVTK